MPTALVTVLGLLAAAGLVALATVRVTHPGTPAHPGAASDARPGGGAPRTPALDVLHRWDAARAAAWASGDAAGLRSLYVAGSGAGRNDLALLRRYTARGLVVRRMRMQVLAVRVLLRRPTRLRLLVTDRLADAEAVEVTGSSRRIALPRDATTVRVVGFRRVAGRWRADAVTAPQSWTASPAATTSPMVR